MTRVVVRAPAFDSIAEMLDWSERHGSAAPLVHVGPDGSHRGSVEMDAAENENENGDED